MKTAFPLIAAAASLLAACAEEATPPAAATAIAAEQACLRDVAATTNNGEVRVVASTFSQAGTEVIVGVGPAGQWRCIAYADGTTAGLQSLTDEGRL
jgi:hypothetical protein